MKPLWCSPSVCCVMEADVWPSEQAGLLLCVHWCPNAQSQGPTCSILVLHKEKKNILSKSRHYALFQLLPVLLELTNCTLELTNCTCMFYRSHNQSVKCVLQFYIQLNSSKSLYLVVSQQIVCF